MSSTIGFSDRNTLRNIGITVTALLGGGVVSYAIYRHWKTNHRPPSQSSQELTRQIGDLKHEIIALKASLTEAVTDFRRELDGIRSAVRSKRYGSVVGSVKTSGSYQTAASEEDDFPSDDEEFAIALDYLEDELRLVDSHDAICARVDQLNAGTDEDKEQAMKILQEKELIYQNSWEFLWRLARAHVGIYGARDDADVRSLHATSALHYAKAAIQLTENSSEVHKWYAISLGTTTDFVGTKEKIEYGFELKKHIDRAIELDPREPTLYFMKGRWCWGVYMLSWIERKLASTLFATPPTATIEDAVNAFTTAENLKPGFYKANQYYLAKCYYEMSNYETAKRWLESAKTLPCNDKDDRDTHKKVEELLTKL